MLIITSLPLLTAFTSSWTIASTGPHVSGHATAVDINNRVLSFGGLTGSAGSPCTNELSAFSDGSWKVLKTTGGPGPRMYAAAACVGNFFYLFGGWDPEAPGSGGSFKDEVWRLDVKALTWEQLEPMPGGPVSRHTACTIGGNKVVVHTFRGILVLDEVSGVLREVPTSGDDPGAVSMSAACALGTEHMLLFGGSTKSQQMSAEVHLLDTATWTWCKLRREGAQGPSPRASACAAPAADGKSAVIFGGAGLGGGGYEGGAGLTAYDETWRVIVEDGTAASWERMDANGIAPLARVAASLDLLPTGSFLLQGGWDPKSKDTYDVPHILSFQ